MWRYQPRDSKKGRKSHPRRSDDECTAGFSPIAKKKQKKKKKKKKNKKKKKKKKNQKKKKKRCTIECPLARVEATTQRIDLAVLTSITPIQSGIVGGFEQLAVPTRFRPSVCRVGSRAN